MKKIITLIVCYLLFGAPAIAQGWSDLGTVYGNGIYSVCSDRNGNIYMAGWFYDTSLNQIVSKWDGTTWTNLGAGSGLLDSFLDVTQIIVDTSGNVYAIGQIFNSVHQYVAKWDGTTWSKVGTLNANSQVGAICFDRYGNLYAAGSFTDGATDSTGHPYVAEWDGISWNELGTGAHALNANNTINTIFVDTFGNVYAAGAFTDSATFAGGNLYVAKWDGTSWSELGSGVCHQFEYDAQICSILVDTIGNVYAAGSLITDSGYRSVMKWNGSSWSQLGYGSSALDVNSAITSICPDRYGNLYAAVWHVDTTIPNSGLGYVAKWDGTSWSELGTGSSALNADGNILSICSDPAGNIYAAGEFTDTMITLTDSLYSTPHSYHPYYIARYSVPTSVAPLHSAAGLKVYPNPAQSILYVSFDWTGAANSDRTYTLYDVTGRLCASGKLQAVNTPIDISGLLPGVYILNVGNSDGIFRVVKE